MKVMDSGTKHPVTKFPISQMSGPCLPEYSYAYFIVIGKETKDMIITNFEWIFGFFNRTSVDGEGGGNRWDKFKLFRVLVPANMSTHW